MEKKDVYDDALSVWRRGGARGSGERSDLFHISVSMISKLFPFDADSVRLTARPRSTGAGRLAASLRDKVAARHIPALPGIKGDLLEGRTFGP
jgi:hypothetical protein